jgi:HEPN domain-containing protein
VPLVDSFDRGVSYWVDIAEYDLETAEAMLITKRYLYVGFMCHQTIEKLLKGYFVNALNDTPPYTHNLSRLAIQAKIYDILNEEQKDFLDTLEPLNIEARYPTVKDTVLKSLNQARCEELIRKTKELSQWIKTQL